MLCDSLLETQTVPQMPSLIDEYGRTGEENGKTALVTLVRVDVSPEQLAAAPATT